jgi:hypothetical protein
LFGGGGVLPSFKVQTSRSLLFFWFVICCLLDGNGVIRKLRKTQHQNPEFDHTQGEIFKKKTLRKSTLAFKGGG